MSLGRAHVSAAIGRADLFRALDCGGEDGLQAMASLLGYEARLMPKSRTKDGDRASESPTTPPSPVTEAQQEDSSAGFQPLPFWRPVSAELSSEEELGRQLSPPEERSVEEPREEDFTAPADALRPAHTPIVAWPRLWRALDDRLRTTVPRSEIDVPELVARWARGESVERLPCLRGLAHAPLLVVVDQSPMLLPLRLDQLSLAGELQRRLGPSTARLAVVSGADATMPRVAPGERVLALTDLGRFGEGRRAAFWERYGAQLKWRGVSAQALVPCPATRWPERAATLWSALEWSAPSRPASRQGRSKPTPAVAEDPVETLLRLASPAIRLEAGLVRDLRRLIPEASVDVEVELWRHSAVASRSRRGLSLDQDEARRRLPLFRELPEAMQQAAIATLAAWHASVAPEIWAEEVWGLLAHGVPESWLDAGTAERSAVLIDKLCLMVERGGEGALASGFEAFYERFRGRASRPLWSHPRLRRSLARAEAALRERREDSEPTAGATPEMFIPSEEEIERWTVWQEGAELRLRRAGDVGEGSPLATISARQPEILVGNGVAADRILEPGGESPSFQIPEGGRPIDVVSDVESIRLELWRPPEWASASGRDEHGLWASFEVGGVQQRLRWISPGRFQMGSPEYEKGRFNDEGPRHWVVHTEGFWIAETPCTQELWQAVMGLDESPSHFKGVKRPAERVSWEDCQMFVDRLNFIVRGLEVQLPTEAEWEYACRSGTQTPYWSGSDEKDLARVGWYRGNSDEVTHEVGRKSANFWGLYDMHGNVFEWCWDWSSSYDAHAVMDPEGPTEGKWRIVRGGCWNDHAQSLRAAYRGSHVIDARGLGVAFRLSRSPGPRAQDAERQVGGSAGAGRGTKPRRRSRRSQAWVERLGWANDGGVDQFGRWASFEVAGVSQRMRWMVPGRFWMGSPESEAGRFGNEGPRHQVTLTEGFWLGETPCTQALWQTVMGENPSEFQSPRRPVEQVSWEDCQRFFEALNGRLPEFMAGLPTEAQWEYACRAGTQTATWLGDLQILGERNAPRLDSIAWYGGNSGVSFDLDTGRDSSGWKETQYPHTRAGTREVGLKQPNPWGLYDMLGNVYEWCQDWQNYTYPEGKQVDPTGPAEGARRVIRGGSWSDPARYVRAAFRNGLHPGDRFSVLGFRLSRGPEPPARAEPKSVEERAELESKLG